MAGDTMSQVVAKIKEQSGIFMPSINIVAIDFITNDEDRSLGLNTVQIVITYNILPINAQDQLQITTTMTN